MKFKFKQTVIRALQGDITAQSVDALVNAANSQLWMGSGVAGAIKRAGGVQIEEEAKARGPIEPGEAVATSAGRLPVKYIIHAAVMGPDLVTGRQLVYKATHSALHKADQLGASSIAFPALGCGVGKMSIAESAEEMLRALGDFLAGNNNIGEVRFVLWGDEAYQEFMQSVKKWSREHPQP